MSSTISNTYIMQVQDVLNLLAGKDTGSRIVVSDLHGNHLPIDGIRWNGLKSVYEIVTTEGADQELVDDLRKELREAEEDYAKLEDEKDDLQKQVEDLENQVETLKENVRELEKK